MSLKASLGMKSYIVISDMSWNAGIRHECIVDCVQYRVIILAEIFGGLYGNVICQCS